MLRGKWETKRVSEIKKNRYHQLNHILINQKSTAAPFLDKMNFLSCNLSNKNQILVLFLFRVAAGDTGRSLTFGGDLIALFVGDFTIEGLFYVFTGPFSLLWSDFLDLIDIFFESIDLFKVLSFEGFVGVCLLLDLFREPFLPSFRVLSFLSFDLFFFLSFDFVLLFLTGWR